VVEQYFIHNDHLGTPQVLSDSSGQAVWQATYGPFGQTGIDEDVDGDGTAVSFNIAFPGQYYDAETGLHYNYFRYYDPSTGRYVTSDPIGLQGGLNTYGYVGGSPIMDIDPYGLSGGRKQTTKPKTFGPDCGSGLTAPMVPDGYFMADFTQACKNHDKCYRTCGSNKMLCDQELLKDLKGTCGGMFNFTCIAVSYVYYDVVANSEAAQEAYDRAQQDACLFCK